MKTVLADLGEISIDTRCVFMGRIVELAIHLSPLTSRRCFDCTSLSRDDLIDVRFVWEKYLRRGVFYRFISDFIN